MSDDEQDIYEGDEEVGTEVNTDEEVAVGAQADGDGAGAVEEAVPEAEPVPAAAAWYDDLPDELKTNPSIQKFKDKAGLAKGYVEAVKKLGQKGIAPLPENASKEQRAAYNAMRRGENIKAPTDYSFAKDSDDKDLSLLKNALFNAGADDYMASEILRTIEQADEAEAAQNQYNAEKVYEKEAERLRADWGEDFLINQKANDILLSRFPEAEKVLKATGADRCYGVAKMLHELSAMASDGQIKISQARTASYSDRIKSIEKSEAYKDANHAGHKRAALARAKLIMEMNNEL